MNTFLNVIFLTDLCNRSVTVTRENSAGNKILTFDVLEDRRIFDVAVSLFYKTDRFHAAVRLFSSRLAHRLLITTDIKMW